MESVRSRNPRQSIVIAALVVAMLAGLIWLFLRPAQRARDIVFGELGRRAAESNNVASRGEGAGPTTLGNSSSNGDPVGTNPSSRSEPNRESENQNPGQTNAVAFTNQPTPASSSSSHQTSSSSVPAVSGNRRPAASNSAPNIHTRAAIFEDNTSAPPETGHKASTAALLAAAKAAGRGPDNPIPGQTSDLLGNNADPARIFDAEAGSNVVFILDNSLSMMANGKSDGERQALIRTLAFMDSRQTFYVVLFHSGGYESMPSLSPLPATLENIRSITNWLFNVGHRTGADPTKAMQRALGLTPAPDTVWLLSDSELPQTVVDNIREANAAVNAHINTLGFYSRDGEQGLRRIADENRGTYRFIPAPDAPSP